MPQGERVHAHQRDEPTAERHKHEIKHDRLLSALVPSAERPQISISIRVLRRKFLISICNRRWPPPVRRLARFRRAIGQRSRRSTTQSLRTASDAVSGCARKIGRITGRRRETKIFQYSRDLLQAKGLRANMRRPNLACGELPNDAGERRLTAVKSSLVGWN